MTSSINNSSTQVTQIMPPGQTPLKQLTTADWERICMGSGPLDIHEVLVKEGFSTEIEGVDFSIGCKLRNHSYISYRGQDLTFIFHHLTFKNCRFDEQNFHYAQFDCTSFTDCDFSDASFVQSRLENTSFKNCRFDGASFHQATLNAPFFHLCTFSESQFLMTTVNFGKLLDCDLTNALLLDTKDHFMISGGTPPQITKPVVALGWDFDHPGIYARVIRESLQDNGALVLLYSQALFPQTISPEKIAQDVVEGAQNVYAQRRIQSINAQTMDTIDIETGAQNLWANDLAPSVQIVQNPNLAEVAKIRQFAESILKASQGLVIPGGADIPSYFYNPTQLTTLAPGDSVNRTVLELALLSEAQKKKIPTMGICRGSQLINVFCGGTLLTLKKTERHREQLTWTPSHFGKPLQDYLGAELVGQSAHHQAADEIGQGLHVVLDKHRTPTLDGRNVRVPKMLLSEDGLLIASQIHPEVYIAPLSSINYLLKEVGFENGVQSLEETQLVELEKRLESLPQYSHDIRSRYLIIERVRTLHRLLNNEPLLEETRLAELMEKVQSDTRLTNTDRYKIVHKTMTFLRKFRSTMPNKRIYQFFLEKVSAHQKNPRARL